MNKKLLSLLAAALLSSGRVFALSVVGPTTAAAKDITLDFSGFARQEGINQVNPRFLNSSIPDQYRFIKTTMELKHAFAWGLKRFGHKAMEAAITLRHKSNFGTSGKTDLTDSQTVKLGSALVGSHNHDTVKPFLWIKEAWISATLNALFGLSTEGLHVAKLGFFGFQLGNGIALGDGYGAGKDFLAVYNKVNDFFAPGFLLTGSLVNKKLEYDAYIGFLENRSSSLKDTFNHTKFNQIGREATPWSGTGNNNNVFAGQLRIMPVNHDACKVTFTPYAMMNFAEDQTFEVTADSRSRLGTYGLGASMHHKRWGIDIEAAQNFGNEELYNIDRNAIIVKQDGEKPTFYYSHIEKNDGYSNYSQAPTIKDLQTTLSTNRHLVNGETFVVDSVTYRSATNRIRPGYKNFYRGFMGIMETYYEIPQLGIMTASAAGYASGGDNPHIVEANKNYRGFVGLHEFFTGKRVKSLFMFDARTVKRPLSFDGTSKVLEDNSFTDIIYFGSGISWSPKKFRHAGFKIDANFLGFFKELASPAIIKDENGNPVASDTIKARSYMGSEMNVIISFCPLDGMNVVFKGATFLPGTYYNDIKGAALSNDIFNQLDVPDTQNLNSDNYRIGTNLAFIAHAIVEYRF